MSVIKEDMRMENQYRKKCYSSSEIMEMQIKTTVRYHKHSLE